MKKVLGIVLPGVGICVLIIAILTCGGRTGPHGLGVETAIEDTLETIPSEAKPVVNVYVENSGSMNGYVNGNTDFKDALHNYLVDINISDIANEMNFFYINSQIISVGNDIDNFKNRLNPISFQQAGGNLATTDIADILKVVLSQTTDKIISIFVSDCIFSPGRNVDANQYLTDQQIKIKASMAEHLKTYSSNAVCVYQLSSQFNGLHFNKDNSSTWINDRKPFYIWIIGSRQHLSELLAKVPGAKFIGSGVENTFTLTQGNQKINYAIRPGTGKFSLDKRNPKEGIVKVKKDRTGKLTFSVNADLSVFLLDKSYLKDEDNYLLNDKDYQLQISDAPSNTHDYTHSLKLTSDKVKPSHLSIKLNMNIPRWIEDINDDIGLNIVADNAMGKTYGIKYLINGVYEAFTQQYDYYTNIKISINN